jgi:hypothetical protein
VSALPSAAVMPVPAFGPHEPNASGDKEKQSNANRDVPFIVLRRRRRSLRRSLRRSFVQ